MWYLSITSELNSHKTFWENISPTCEDMWDFAAVWLGIEGTEAAISRVRVIYKNQL